MQITNLYLTTEGRINRKIYLLGMLPLIVTSIVALLFDQMIQSEIVFEYGVFQLLAMALLIWPSLCLGIKRLHDRNRPWWFVLLSYIPLINLWIMIELVFLKGTEGENTFGGNPLIAKG